MITHAANDKRIFDDQIDKNATPDRCFADPLDLEPPPPLAERCASTSCWIQSPNDDECRFHCSSLANVKRVLTYYMYSTDLHGKPHSSLRDALKHDCFAVSSGGVHDSSLDLAFALQMIESSLLSLPSAIRPPFDMSACR